MVKNMAILEYFENDNLYFTVDNHEFITIMGNGNKNVIDNLVFKNKNNYIKLEGNTINSKKLPLYRSKVAFVLNEHLNTFTSETVEDELAFCMENLCVKTTTMHEKVLENSVKFDLDDILNSDSNSIGSSKKALIKIISCLLFKPKVLILDNILCELDRRDKEKIIPYLKQFVKEGNAIINFTADIEDTLYGNYIILLDKERVIASGRTLSILNEEKLMNRLGLSLPFIVDLNKQLMYYDIIDKYTLDEEGLVDEIWK